MLSRAANCTPASGRKFLEYNNVSALIETGGSMWLDRSRGKNAYEVPKGSGNTLVYIGALWMGGMDVNNQLKIAALRYRIGNDFWAGPLSTNPGSGDIINGKLGTKKFWRILNDKKVKESNHIPPIQTSKDDPSLTTNIPSEQCTLIHDFIKNPPQPE